jgi:aspartate kinase
VDGIFTADPRKVPTARLLSMITPEEAAELTYYGSEVIHPFTMEQVIREGIQIRIKNVERPTGAGTVIFPDRNPTPTEGSVPGSPVAYNLSTVPSNAFLHANGYNTTKVRRTPTAVTTKDSITVLNVRSNRKTISHGFFAKIFATLDKYGIAVDLISTSEVHVSMAIHGTIKPAVLERVLEELRPLGEVGNILFFKNRV